MAKKDFTIAKKPGAGTSDKPVAQAVAPAALGTGEMTRKTIEVPKDYFKKVKGRAVEREIKEKELWAEILQEYFKNNP